MCSSEEELATDGRQLKVMEGFSEHAYEKLQAEQLCTDHVHLTDYHSSYHVCVMMRRVLRAWLGAGKPCRRETSTMPQWAGSCW